MIRLEALRALYDGIKAGTFCQGDVLSQEEGALLDACFGPLSGDVAAWEYVTMALSDDVSAPGAALAFIAATLPRWTWEGGTLSSSATVYAPDYPGEDFDAPCYSGEHPDPATALLLAGLAAHIAEEERK